MKKIPLTQGKFALIDDEDFERVGQFRWRAHWDGWNWYSVRYNGKGTIQWLHRFILDAPADKEVDHINGGAS